jgi:biopolymer transport protein ExbD
MSARWRKKAAPLQLQLTSLLDMFTIILVFLLESFQSEDQEFVLHAGLELPASSARNPFKKAVNIAVSPDSVFVDGVAVAPLGPDPTATDEIEAVTEAVRASWVAKDDGSGEEMVATLQADEGLPYETLDRVMRSAARAGCARFRLVVEKG